MRARQPHPSTPRFLTIVALSALGGLVLSGCGGMAPKADAPPPSPTSAPADDADSAQNELDKGEWRITELFGPPGGVRPSVNPEASAAPAASAAPTQPAVQAPKAAELSGGDGSKAPDACTVACSALASMDRAARHLCEMAGPDEPLCTSARERVRNANDRVAAHCTCGI